MKELKILTTLVILILTLLIITSVIIMVNQEQQKQQIQNEYRLINVMNTSLVDCHTIRHGQTYNQTHCIYVNEPRNLTRFVSQ